MGQDPKDPKDPEHGTPPGTPPGNPDPNVRALQQKLTEKDKEMKSLQTKIEELEKKGSGDHESQRQIAELTATVKTLTEEIGKVTTDRKREELRQKYPDILPELLIGKSDEEVESLVKRQRETMESRYERRPSAHEPQFKDRQEVDTEIERVKGDRTIDTDAKLLKVRELERRKQEL